MTTDALQAFPSGDAFSVYPFQEKAVASIRSKVFYEGLQDRMMLKLAEAKIGKEKTKALVNKIANQNINFKKYPPDEKYFNALREAIINVLK